MYVRVLRIGRLSKLRHWLAEDETHELFDLCFKRVEQIWWEVDTDGTEGMYIDHFPFPASDPRAGKTTISSLGRRYARTDAECIAFKKHSFTRSNCGRTGLKVRAIYHYKYLSIQELYRKGGESS